MSKNGEPGSPFISAQTEELRGTTPKLVEMTGEYLFGDLWERPGLSKRDRSMITVAVLTALYRTDQIGGHIRRALGNGVTAEELSEVVTHVTMYSGWPCGMSAARILMNVLNEKK